MRYQWVKLSSHASTSQYCNNDPGEDNVDAHIKHHVMDHEVVVAVTKGKVEFGMQNTRGADLVRAFDDNRRKHVLVKIIGE